VFRIWKKANVLRPHLSSTALAPAALLLSEILRIVSAAAIKKKN